MSPEFPYQLVAFLDKAPSIGEGVYQGEHGWYPQITLKRRFKIAGIDELKLTEMIETFCSDRHSLAIQTGKLVKPERMPVRILEILNDSELRSFHMEFIDYMGRSMESRFPERDGENYLPHITAEYDGKFVIDVDAFALKSFTLRHICLIKDAPDTDSHVIKYFDLHR